MHSPAPGPENKPARKAGGGAPFSMPRSIPFAASAIAPLAAALVMLCAAAPAQAQAGRDLAQQKNCLTCHGANRGVLGPGFREIAARYAGKAEAQAQLVERVLHGGVGNWGKVPMPANTQLSDADARALVTWILETR
ncbi:MAG: c-type cytochrome [Candidatus Protistobacter heckmanni]|nr:c-type cytochrome [Candidatus Protistobacter heckmanni]